MTYFARTIMTASLSIALTACGATTEERIGNAIGFAIATEVLRQNPAVISSFDPAPATPITRTDFADLRNAGTVTYTGQIALYADDAAIGLPGPTELPSPDVIGRIDLQAEIGATQGTFAAQATEFVSSDSEALSGNLQIRDGQIRSATIGDRAVLSGRLDGTVTDATATRPYRTQISGGFAQDGEALAMTGSTDGADNDGNAFATVIGAIRD